MKAIWITWEVHRRTREIARALDAELFEFKAPGGWRRYPRLLLQTMQCLLEHRPTHVFVQCPSIVLAVWTLLLKALLGYTLVADLHNEAVTPFINRSRTYRWVLRFIHRSASLNVVTNDRLVAIVAANGGRAVVLPDRVPTIAHPVEAAEREGNLVVFVCTFAPDEPYQAVIAAASQLSDAVRVRITGNPPPLPEFWRLPRNVTLTRFLPAAAYEQLLAAADVIVDLTEMEDCLVCGAYEAAALARPLVTSDTAALRTAFPAGAVFTKHDPDSIAAAIRDALERRKTLEREMSFHRARLEAEWQWRCEALVRLLSADFHNYGGIRPPMHPAPRRCSSLKYSRYSPSSRLAGRAPRRPNTSP